MVSCILCGGAGNNLFQISATISYGLKHNIDFFFPTKVQSPHYAGQKVFYSPYLNYNDSYSELWDVVYQEPFFHYQEIPKYDFEVIVLRGYFQSWRYIDEYRNEILRLLNIKISQPNNKVFIHQRLGDYKNLQKFHTINSEEYLINAISFFNSLGYNDFLVFSDEIHIAKQIINSEIHIGSTFEYSEGKTELEDLSLMAACKHGIMSASSFSWWAAYIGMNEDRVITYPSKWFGEKANHNTVDLCPPEWVKIKS